MIDDQVGRGGPGVHGTVAPGYEAVREVFTGVLRQEGADLDTQVAAYHRGRKVVDLWAGPDTGPDSLLGIYSASKGIVHMILALLVQDGVVDLDEPVSRYWPEFRGDGKERLLLRELCSHQAGLVGTDTGFSVDELADDVLVAERLAAHHPFWRPGTASGYHALVMGALSAEVIRRATGRPVQEHIKERLVAPYGLDLHFGLPTSEDHRFLPAQPMISTPERAAGMAATETAADSISGIAFNRHHPAGCEVWELPNQASVRRRGTASFGGLGTARDLAKVYAALIFGVDGAAPALTQATAAAFGQIQTNGPDLVLRVPKAWAVGFHASSEVYPVLGAGAFGHSGAGGQQALVDPRSGISYAFLRRRFLYPAQADRDHGRLLAALLESARSRA